MSDVQGLLADPQFQHLDPATQKQVLGRIDSQFSNLNEDQLRDFVSRATPPPQKSLIDRAKDYFNSIPNIMNITPNGIQGRDGVWRQPNTGSEPTKWAQAGFMGPQTSVPGSVAQAAGKKAFGRVGKFFEGIGDDAAAIRGEIPEPVSPPSPASAATPAAQATAEEISTAKNLGGKFEDMTPSQQQFVRDAIAKSKVAPATPPEAPVKAPGVSMSHYEQTGQSFGTRMIQHATAKDATIIQHLQSNGLTPEQFEAMPTPVKNDWIAKVNAATGKSYEYYRGAQGDSSITRLLKTWRYLKGPAAPQ